MTDDSEAAELQEYEAERRERRLRRNRTSGVVVAWVMAVALALLAHDSYVTALGRHRGGRPWAYPAGVAVTCVIALLVLAAYGLHRVRRR